MNTEVLFNRDKYTNNLFELLKYQLGGALDSVKMKEISDILFKQGTKDPMILKKIKMAIKNKSETTGTKHKVSFTDIPKIYLSEPSIIDDIYSDIRREITKQKKTQSEINESLTKPLIISIMSKVLCRKAMCIKIDNHHRQKELHPIHISM